MTRITDFKKRTTLKTLSTAAAVAITPTLASAVNRSGPNAEVATTRASEGLHLTFNGAASPKRHSVTLTNQSDRAITVKHVSPGLVASEGSLFDINALLTGGPMTLQPGESRSLSMLPVARNTRESTVPGGVIHPHAVTVSSRYNAYPFANETRVAQTRRMLLS